MTDVRNKIIGVSTLGSLIPGGFYSVPPIKTSRKGPVPESTARLIGERASGLRLPEVFGSEADVEAVGYESLLPAYFKKPLPKDLPKVRIGGPDCKQPYNASVLNCSALSFGPLSRNAILALNKAAFLGGFFQNTGEAGISTYHFGTDVDMGDPSFNFGAFLEDLVDGRYPESNRAGDVVWQLGTGYFGCRDENGDFDPVAFQKKVRIPNVKMIEVKLSQGVEPCKILPAKGMLPAIANMMGIQDADEAVLKDRHTCFATPIELLDFIRELRERSDGKPIGIKLGISHRHYFLAICKAMLKTGIVMDFITIDGMEAGTAAASKGASGFTGTPLNDAIVFVHNALVGCNLRDAIKIIVSGRVFTEKDMISKLARGADVCSTARGMLLSIGCDQQLECYKGTCLKGIATQDSHYANLLDIDGTAQKAYHYHAITTQEFYELLAIAGLEHPNALRPWHVQKRVSVTEVKPLDAVYELIAPGAFLRWFGKLPAAYRADWKRACANMPF